jgi:hypothetical protein
VSAVDTTRDCAASVGAVFSSVYAQVENWRAALQPLLASGSPDVAAIDSLVENLVVPVLSERSSLIVGAGFVAAPQFLPGAPWHLAWWLGKFNTFGLAEATGATRRLRAPEDPTAESFRDYTTLEWWRVPAQARVPHITGPYVDYLCTDDYTLTLTVPVVVDDVVVGVIGADLYVEDVERLLLPALRAMSETVTLVNRAGRVVVSTNPHRATGSIYRLDGLIDSLRGDKPSLPNQVPIIWGGTTLALLVD